MIPELINRTTTAAQAPLTISSFSQASPQRPFEVLSEEEHQAFHEAILYLASHFDCKAGSKLRLWLRGAVTSITTILILTIVVVKYVRYYC